VLNFHALRVAFCSYLFESGASAKEAQVLARHSTPALTMNTYGRARNERLQELSERMGRVVEFEQRGAECVQASMHRQAVHPKREAGKTLSDKQLPAKEQWRAMRD
jgi:hypothetical protein